MALLDEESFYSLYSIAEALGVSHSTVLGHLRDSLGMNIFHLCWVSHELTTNLRQIRMESCRELLPILKAHEKTNFTDL
jgi:AraC-like DNA-binding protein